MSRSAAIAAIAAQVGIAGSTMIGDGVMIGGAAGINGHITIGDGVQIAAMSGVASGHSGGASATAGYRRARCATSFATSPK